MSDSRARIQTRENRFGDLTTENFDNDSIHVRISTPTKSSRNSRGRSQKLRVYSRTEGKGLSLDGAQARALYNVLSKHFDEVM